jgi:hypothetical protein
VKCNLWVRKIEWTLRGQDSPLDPAGGPCKPFSMGSFTSSVIGWGITGGLAVNAGDDACCGAMACLGLGVERRMAGLGASFLSFPRLFTHSGTLPMLFSACGFTCTVAISCNKSKQVNLTEVTEINGKEQGNSYSARMHFLLSR